MLSELHYNLQTTCTMASRESNLTVVTTFSLFMEYDTQ